MILEQKAEKIHLVSGNASYVFLPSGDVYEFTSGPFMINQFIGNTIDGSLNNIYIRIYTDHGMKVVPLLGRKSNSEIFQGQNELIFIGTAEGIGYQVRFQPTEEGMWFWNITLDGNGQQVDLIYGQDVGVADKGGVLSSELYMSQYLDHKIIDGNWGYTVSSRQNQSQGGRFPYLQQGSIGIRTIGYATDGMQFFGKSFKDTDEPELLYKDLPNVNYQYELSYIAFQTEKITLNGKMTAAFYGMFREDHPTAVKELEFGEELIRNYQDVIKHQEDILSMVKLAKPVIKTEIGSTYSSPEFSKAEINSLYPDRHLEEDLNGELLSFFTTDHRYVVLKKKEILVERPHGNIITTLLNDEKFEKDLITSTNYMYGLFHAQITIGNTNMNKMTSVNRGLLNVLKNTGMRVYVKVNGTYRLLTLPAAYELGINYSKWFYRLEEDVIEITSFAAAKNRDMVLDIKSKQGKEYDFLITQQLVMGSTEFSDPVFIEEQDGVLTLEPAYGSAMRNTYPNIRYQISLPNTDFQWSDDQCFYEDGITRNGTLLVISASEASLQLIIHGELNESLPISNSYQLATEFNTYLDFYKNFLKGFHLEAGDKQEEVDKFNEIIWWYTHNALVHYAVPHGLEQSGGAAWGTRDVCQGPMEYFLVTGHYALARNTLLEIFSHQMYESKEWPQWFMFDNYPYHAGDCHGDVVFWPLKCIGDYLNTTKDYSILSEVLAYQSESGKEVSDTLLAHIRLALEAVQERFLYDTALISYAGGDWDDTLQPASQDMKEKLVSSWTEALAYQAFVGLGKAIRGVDDTFANEIEGMSLRMKEAFEQILIKDGVIAGFAYLNSKDDVNYMLHPDDNQTGINYRLLPLTRSIISELVPKDQADINLQVINEHLTFPDGVRLMNRPARYDGGVSVFFQRAEQASNVGREISLQYVHAHIRYIEAMAKLGNAQEAWKGLLQINPIKLSDIVPNAELRQSNTYYSSSEGAYNTRYEYQEEFERLREGNIKVKGGWRIYSSGPGIYLTNLISNVLGIRQMSDRLGIDPVIPKDFDDLHFTFRCFDKDITFIYRLEETAQVVTKVQYQGNDVSFERMANPYREGGVWLSREFIEGIQEDNPKLYIYMR